MEPDKYLPMNRAELIARCEALESAHALLEEGPGALLDANIRLRDRVTVLEAALRQGMCPRPYPDNEDEQVGWCVDFGQCGCGMKAALQSETGTEHGK